MKALDIETKSLVEDHPEYALQPWRVQSGEAEISLVAVGDGDKADFIDVTDLNRLKGETFICWNTMFDCAFLYAAGINVDRHQWLDAMLVTKWAENCQDNDQMGFSLAAVAKRRLKDWSYLEQFLKLKATEADQAYDKYWKVRAKLDVMSTFLIFKSAWAELTGQQRKSAAIEAGNIVPNAKAWVKGLPTNPKYYDDPIPELSNQMMEIELRLGICNTGAQQDPSSGWTPSKILRSPKQLASLLYETWKLPCTQRTDKGAPATDKAALTYLSDKDDKVLEILAWRRLNTLLTKFCQSPRKAADYLGSTWLHPEPKIFSTYTGRYTYGSKSGKKGAKPIAMALHQIPRGPQVRRMVEAPEGKILVEFDAAAQEARLLAEIGNIESMISVFGQQKKLHAVTGAAIGGIPYDEFMKRYKAGEPAYAGPEGLYYAGKFCIAAGQLVDTDRGAVPIESVTVDDLVWDGVEYVHHDGVVCMGRKQVIEKGGLVATPDHKVLTAEGWKEFNDVRYGDIIRQDAPLRWGPLWALGSNKQPVVSTWQHALYAMSLQVWRREICERIKSATSQINSMQELCSQLWSGRQDLSETVSCNGGSLHQPAQPVVPQLWGAGDQRSVRQRSGVLRVYGVSIPRCKPSAASHRSDRQQQGLRAREYQADHQLRESAQQALEPYRRVFRSGSAPERLMALIKNRFSGLQLFSGLDNTIGKARSLDRGNTRDGQVTSPNQREEVVYDIINAGPRNRFTIQGRIVSNCNLSMQYRVGLKKHRVMARVQYDLNKDETTIKRWRDLYHSTYPEVRKYWDRAVQVAKQQGYAETLGGRRYYLNKWGEGDRWGTESSAINFPIQGTGGDMKNLAITTLAAKFPELEFAFDLHDGVHYWADRTKAGLELIIDAREALNNLDYASAWGRELKVALPWDASIATHWGDMREI